MQTGLLKISNGIIQWADRSAAELLAPLAPIVGKPIGELFPDYRSPADVDRVRSRTMTIEGFDYLVQDVRLPPPADQIILTITRMDALDRAAGDGDPSEAPRADIGFDTLIESLHDDIVVTDGKGIILHVSSAFLEVYDVTEAEVVGKSVHELERRKVFQPSVAAMVLASGEEMTRLQRTQRGDHLVITAVPVFDAAGELVQVVSYSRNIPEFFRLKKQYEALEDQVRVLTSKVRELSAQDGLPYPGVIAASEAMQRVIALAMKVAGVDANLIITGESGVGKNLLARLIHQKSGRSEGPMIEINCGAIPENLLESELFGYEPGAYTGASRSGKAGMIELAHTGTLFLDEIGELPLPLQVKLLKVIQEKTLTRIGGTRPTTVDFRLISATNHDLAERVRQRKFRDDLYYRLNVVPIKVPPLRERREDVLVLARHFLETANRQYGQSKRISPDALKILSNHDWPGNVRELRNLIERLVITAEAADIVPADLPGHLASLPPMAEVGTMTLEAAKALLEKKMVLQAYERYGTTVAVGRALGISQPSAARKIKKYAVPIHQ